MSSNFIYLKKNNNYNLNYNLDIIEFIVFQQIEGRRNLIYPQNHYESHYHNFTDNIIIQPNLSELLFHKPMDYNMHTHSICRNIWNKIIRRNIFLEMSKYIGLDYFYDFVITADDMSMNVIIYHFANNYSNIFLPGYMYNIRPISMSHGDGGIKLNKIRAINYFLYFKIVYRYIKQFNISRKILFHELRNLKRFIYSIKDNNMTDYEYHAKNFLNEILNDIFVDKLFKSLVVELLLYFNRHLI